MEKESAGKGEGAQFEHGATLHRREVGTAVRFAVLGEFVRFGRRKRRGSEPKSSMHE